MARRSPASPRRRFAMNTVVAAIAVFSVLAGTATSYAFWTATATTPVTSTTGDVRVAVANFSTSALTNHGPMTTGYVTVTNQTVQNAASTTAANLSLVFARSGGTSTGSTAFATATTLAVWPEASAANCTNARTPSGGSSGTWGGSGLTVTGTLAKGASRIYCVRTSLASPVAAGVSSGVNDFTAQITANLAVGNFTGTAAAAASQATAYIYPLGTTSTSGYQAIYVGGLTTLCVDVEDASTAVGSEIIPWGCHGGVNQQWRFVAAATSGYYEIYPSSATTTRMSVAATTSGSAVTIQADNGTAGQDWQLQTTATGTYQLVNRSTGFCLTSSSATANSNSPMTQLACNGTASQRFQPSSGTVVPLAAFNCTVDGSGDNRNLQLTWTSITGSYTLWIDGVATSTTTSGTTTGMTRTINEGSYAIGSHTYTVVHSSGQQVASGTFTMTREPVWFWTRDVLSGCTP